MMQPTQLLQDLGVVWVSVQHTLVSVLSTVKVLLLLVNVADLKPNIFLGQRRGWRVDNVFEALDVCQYTVPWWIYTWVGGRTSRLWLYFCCCLYMIPRRK